MSEKAYQEGQTARREGKGRDENPYPYNEIRVSSTDNTNRLAWFDGFDDCDCEESGDSSTTTNRTY